MSRIKNPTDVAGAIASNRFDYQKDWALSKIIELCSQDRSFITVFDYYDDVLIFEPSTSPRADFYQVKSLRDKAWTAGELLRRRGSSLSKLGKLRDSKERNSALVATLNFVSNAGYNISLADGTPCGIKEKVCLNELAKEQRDLIEKKLEKEFGNASLSIMDDAFLLHSSLGIDGHSEEAQARLANLFEKLFPTVEYKSKTIYDSLATEIARRNNIEKTYSTREALLNEKGLSSDDFRAIIGQYCKRIGPDKLWAEYSQSLVAEGWTARRLHKLKDAILRLWMELNNPESNHLIELCEQITQILKNENYGETYSDAIIHVTNQLRSTGNAVIYSEFDLAALTLLNYDEPIKQLSSPLKGNQNQTI